MNSDYQYLIVIDLCSVTPELARIERRVERVQLRLNYAFTFRALKVASEKMPPVF